MLRRGGEKTLRDGLMPHGMRLLFGRGTQDWLWKVAEDGESVAEKGPDTRLSTIITILGMTSPVGARMKKDRRSVPHEEWIM